jgi:hypothetical protein
MSDQVLAFLALAALILGGWGIAELALLSIKKRAALLAAEEEAKKQMSKRNQRLLIVMVITEKTRY